MGNNYCQLSGSFIKTSVRGVSIRSEEIRENRKKICPINETWFVFPISLITCGTDWTREWKGKEIVENNIITWSSIPSRENFLLCSQSRPEESETRYMRRSLVIVLCVCNEAGKTSLSWIWTLPKCIFFQFCVTMNVSLGWDDWAPRRGSPTWEVGTFRPEIIQENGNVREEGKRDPFRNTTNKGHCSSPQKTGRQW